MHWQYAWWDRQLNYVNRWKNGANAIAAVVVHSMQNSCVVSYTWRHFSWHVQGLQCSLQAGCSAAGCYNVTSVRRIPILQVVPQAAMPQFLISITHIFFLQLPSHMLPMHCRCLSLH
jgi:hypothetical protein